MIEKYKYQYMIKNSHIPTITKGFTVLSDIYGFKRYAKNNLYHRIIGPALIFRNGDKAWYIDGNFIKMKRNK